MTDVMNHSQEATKTLIMIGQGWALYTATNFFFHEIAGCMPRRVPYSCVISTWIPDNFAAAPVTLKP
jgi:hypothetical protein